MNKSLTQNSLFIQDWWWEAVCPSQERMILKTEGGARWNMACIRRLGMFSLCAMPPLTQHAGPYLSDRSDFIKMLAQIPPKRQICINVGFALNEEECRFAAKQGMKVVRRQSHRLEDLSDLEAVYRNVKPPRQRQIRKAERLLKTVEIDDIEPLIALQTETFHRQGLRSPYPPQTVRNLYRAIQQHDAGRLIALADAQDRIMACGLFVHDDTTCYSLTHGYDTLAHDMGAGSLLQWEGIRYAASKNLVFDFEGSNIESIAQFNSSFGAIPVTYSRIERHTTFFRVGERVWRLLKRIR
ncbi:MAG: GNAT family N-acetyltransferase [Bacteroides sp.]|nr:GNAT family N-acetyltransferase [Ruminococcus flavefaciens]MCM1555550.1 GNAT family N-acetyltransferase [Bacteroides sp.]